MKTITINTLEGEITYQLASFWERLGARIIDVIIIIIPNSIIPIIPAWLYWGFMQSGKSQATIGQQALNIKVVDITGDKIGFGQSSGRFFGNFLNIITCFLGYFMFFFNKNNQCLHDFLSSTVVVKNVEIHKTDNILRHLIDS